MKTITLNRDAICHKCGAELPAGRRARFGYGRIYCANSQHGGRMTKAERLSALRALSAKESSDNWHFAMGHIDEGELDQRRARIAQRRQEIFG